MSISTIVLISMVVLATGYVLYGRFLRRQFGPDDPQPTPAWEFQDGVDYVPAKMPLLLGQHHRECDRFDRVEGSLSVEVVLPGRFNQQRDPAPRCRGNGNRAKPGEPTVEECRQVRGWRGTRLFQFLLEFVESRFVVVHRQAAPDDGKVEAVGVCLSLLPADSAVRGDFPGQLATSKCACARLRAVIRQQDPSTLAEKEIAMNVENVELQAVAEVAKTDEAIELLALSLDDLDLVAGGSSLGSLL